MTILSLLRSFRKSLDFDAALLRLLLILAAVACVLTGATAFAADAVLAPSPGAPGGPAWVTALVQYVAPPLIGILGALMSAALVKLTTFLHAKEGNSKLAGALAIASDFVSTAFTHVRAGIEPDLKLALADGTLDEKERADLVKKLVALAKAELPVGVMGILGGAFGPALETWLQGKAGQVVQAAVMASASPGELAVPK